MGSSTKEASNDRGGKDPGYYQFPRRNIVDKSKSVESMETKLKKITALSVGDPKKEFNWLMPLFNRANLISCFRELDGKKAIGADGITKEEYGKNLEGNIDNLIERMKKMSYRPGPVREVLIPKEDGKFRPLGISGLEDKIVQSMYNKILGAIYEPLFYDFSYGFRPGRSCHDAIKAVRNHLYHNPCEVVIDVDLKNYFGKICHQKLLLLLRMKIKDETFIRYIVRMLKSGILSEGELRVTDEGTPQGSIVSPILSNIFAHYALDKWFKEVVENCCHRMVKMYRYADDCARRRSPFKLVKVRSWELTVNPSSTSTKMAG